MGNDYNLISMFIKSRCGETIKLSANVIYSNKYFVGY